MNLDYADWMDFRDWSTSLRRMDSRIRGNDRMFLFYALRAMTHPFVIPANAGIQVRVFRCVDKYFPSIMQKLGKRIFFILHTSTLILLFAGCSKLVPDVRTGTGRGIVRRLDFEHHEVTLSHGTVPNLLHPMTYAYAVSNDSIMRTVSEGDTVSFTIEESHPGTFRVLSMKPIHPAPRPPIF